MITKTTRLFYILAGFRDRYGKTFQFGYTVFGIAFYNFRLKIVSDGTRYNTVIGEDTIEEAIEKGEIPEFTYYDSGSGERVIYLARNESLQEVMRTVSYSTDSSETEANSITNAEEYSFTESERLSIELNQILKLSKMAAEMRFKTVQLITMICKNRLMSPAGGTLTESGRSISTTSTNAIALYPLKTIRNQTGSGSYDVGVDDVLYPGRWTVQGYDKDNIPFYGFNFRTGRWILTDEYGVELKDDSLAVIKTEPLTHEPFIQGKKECIVYAK